MNRKLSRNIRYATITVVKNEQDTIVNTMNSIVTQTLKPNRIVVVDDGSTDKTPRYLKWYRDNVGDDRGHRIVEIVTLPDRGFSVTGSPLMAKNYNAGLDRLWGNPDWDYLVIVAGDTVIPPNYVKSLLDKMNQGDIKYGVASGFTAMRRVASTYATGSGRAIRRKILEELNGYPEIYSWETVPIIKAWQLGYKTGHFKDVAMKTRAIGGGRRKMKGWGRGMKDSGYYFPMVLYRLVSVALLERHPIRAFWMAWGYFTYRYKKQYEWQHFHSNYQKQNIKSKVKRMFKR